MDLASPNGPGASKRTGSAVADPVRKSAKNAPYRLSFFFSEA
jgi:hypothetical protein